MLPHYRIRKSLAPQLHMNPTLLITQGVQHGQVIRLSSPSTIFGRGTSCDVQLYDLEVSRQHFAIELRHDAHVWLVDQQSHNGTYVNGKRVREFQLQTGDTIRIGQTEMLYSERPSRANDTSDITAFIRDSIPGSADSVLDELLSESRSKFRKNDATSPVPLTAHVARAKSSAQLLYELSQLLRQTLDSEQLLREMLRLIFDWIEADRGCIVLLDQELDTFRIVASLTRIAGDDQPMVISQSIVQHVYRELEGILIQDAPGDPRCRDSESVISLGISEAICVPLLVRQGFRGAIYLDTLHRHAPLRSKSGNEPTPHHVFNQDDLRLLISFGQQAAIALDNAHYYHTLLQSQRLTLLGETVASLAHDVRGILQGLQGAIYQLEASWKRQDHPNMAANWEILKLNHQRMQNLVMDMLSFSGPRQPQFRECEIAQVVQEVLDVAQEFGKFQGVALRYLGDRLLPNVWIDKQGIFRALLNLVLNAIDACKSSANPLISITTRMIENDETLAVVVEDNGHGISPQEMPYLFEPFRTTKGLEGNGLGLAVSRKILQDHGGDIKVTSVLGKGSEFALLVPARRPLPESNTLESSPY